MALVPRPFASVAVAAVLTATTLVPAQEIKKAARPEGTTTTTEVKTTVQAKPAGPAPFQIGEFIRIFPAAAAQPVPKQIQQVVNPQLIESHANQFRPVLRAEYQLILAVCAPSKDQRREIARAGERASSAAYKAAEWQGMPRLVVARNGVNQVEHSGTQPDPRGIIREGLAAAVKEQLSSEQAARYQKETELKAAEEKQAAVRSLVDQLDQLLLLSGEQRAKIADSLSTNWDGPWRPSLQSLLVVTSTSYFPTIPDPLIVPALNDVQASVWNVTAKVSRSNWAGYFNVMGPDPNPLEDAELAPAANR